MEEYAARYFERQDNESWAKRVTRKGVNVPGHAVLTDGFALHAKHVAHAVGPSGRRPALLANCYRNVLDLCLQNKLRSIAFCCISTGIFGFPNELAARVAVKTCREWIEEDRDNRVKAFDAIVFCVYVVFECEAREFYNLKYNEQNCIVTNTGTIFRISNCIESTCHVRFRDKRFQVRSILRRQRFLHRVLQPKSENVRTRSKLRTRKP